MKAEFANIAGLVAGWIACAVALRGLWWLGLREMAFFRLVLEYTGEDPRVRGAVGLVMSLGVYLMLLVSVVPMCGF